MYCPQCGTENQDGSSFCRHCGTRLDGAGASGAASVGGQQPAADAAGYGQADAGQPYAGAPNGANPHGNPYGGPAGSPYGQPVSAYPPYGQPQPVYQQPVSAGTCLSEAWADVRGSEGWVGKACLLGLVNAVPILNFVTAGYILRWARQLATGARLPMPKGLFVDRAFVVGFFATVLYLISYFVSGIATAIVGWVPLLGALAAFAFSIFFGMFVDASVVRMAIVDRFGAAFDFGKVWRAYKRSLGGLFCASVVPLIVAGIVIVAVVIVYVIVLTVFIGSGAVSISIYSSHHVAYEGVGTIVATVVLWIVVAMALAVAQLVSLRAIGHWVVRVAPDWCAETPEAGGTPYGQHPYSQPPYGGQTNQYPPYGQSPYGQDPYSQQSYGNQPPYQQ